MWSSNTVYHKCNKIRIDEIFINLIVYNPSKSIRNVIMQMAQFIKNWATVMNICI